MCGIAGIVEKDRSNHQVMTRILEVMAHRGPDHQAIYTHQSTTLGHLRLSIIDLLTGDQPVFNEDKNLCIIYNGELYNYKELQKELIGRGHAFNTSSDTEVILHGYEEYGPDILSRLNGMFAFAIYNHREESVFLARDHFGIKPLHYHLTGKRFIFASEQKGIIQHPDVERTLNPDSLHHQLNLRYNQRDETLLQGIKRLPPAHYAIYRKNQLTVRRYWQLEPSFSNDLNERKTIEKMHDYLLQAVKRQLVSDVPLGVYLSGGMDSSTIVQKMHELKVPEINTFTLGFNEPTDEFSDAAMIARHFGTHHRTHALSFNPLEDLKKTIWHAEEPKINLLQGYNMSAFVKQHLKVVLGGLGGDEIFAGYDIHKFIYPTNRLQKHVPGWLKKILRWKSDFLFKVQHKTKSLTFDEYRRGVQMLLSIGQVEKYYLIIRNTWDFDQSFYQSVYNPDFIRKLSDSHQVAKSFIPLFNSVKEASALDQVLFAEIHSKMVNDYLLVEDRMSMSHSVEERVPFLDIDLVQFAMDIPISLKIKHNQTKYIFRKAMEEKLPPRIVKKKKWGFTANPYLQFKKDLKSAAEQKLTKEFIEQQGIFNYEYINSIIRHKPSSRMRWHYNFLWVVLGFAHWEALYLGRNND
ncbi:MAG: asparagine synthase (glutamine-hydrolyzing), partial [Saprospiraceae bacterium]|nr:asparagine synthase (glutamine-hydrolyzing) [Saprospiraceae bacterium]